jgi:hypothetical protein
MIATTFYRPTNAEETAGLIAETRNAVIHDGRVAEAVIAQDEALFLGKADKDGSPTERAGRMLRRVLPGHESQDMHDLRVSVGWTALEIRRVAAALNIATDTLLCARPMLSGTLVTLAHDADRYRALAERWKDLTTVNA